MLTLTPKDGKGLFLVFQFPDCLPLPNQNEQKGNFKDDESNQGENKKEVNYMLYGLNLDLHG